MKNDTTNLAPQRSPDATLRSKRVGLITEYLTYAQQVREVCTPAYEVALISPHTAVKNIHIKLKQLQIIALLVQWDRSTIACAARLTRLQMGIPIIALCEPRPAQHVAALMMGADFAIIQPPTPALLQALRVAYRQRGKARRLLPPPDDDEAGDGFTLNVSERTVPSMPSPGAAPWPSESERDERHNVLQCGPFLMDVEAHRLLVEGKPVTLKPRSFALCAHLIQRSDRCCTRDELLQEIWGLDFDPSTNIVDVQIYAIRKALDQFGLATAIQTVHGIGYKFQWPPSPKIP